MYVYVLQQNKGRVINVNNTYGDRYPSGSRSAIKLYTRVERCDSCKEESKLNVISLKPITRVNRVNFRAHPKHPPDVNLIGFIYYVVVDWTEGAPRTMKEPREFRV